MTTRRKINQGKWMVRGFFPALSLTALAAWFFPTIKHSPWVALVNLIILGIVFGWLLVLLAVVFRALDHNVNQNATGTNETTEGLSSQQVQSTAESPRPYHDGENIARIKHEHLIIEHDSKTP